MTQNEQEKLPPGHGGKLDTSLRQKEAEKLQKAFELLEQTRAANETLISRIAPWFFEFGSWIFGGLIAYSIVLLQSPILNAAVIAFRGDRSMVVCTLMLALALPLDIFGLILLRVFGDLRRFDLGKVVEESFEEVVDATYPTYQKPDPVAVERWQKKRMAFVFNISISLLAVGLALTIAATAAAIWFVMWWAAIVFLLMLGVIFALLVIIGIFIEPFHEIPHSEGKNEQKR